MSTAALIRKLGGYFPVGPQLRADLADMVRERFELDAGQTLVAAGDRFSSIFMVEQGWILRARHLASGGRQIVNFALAGDFL